MKKEKRIPLPWMNRIKARIEEYRKDPDKFSCNHHEIDKIEIFLLPITNWGESEERRIWKDLEKDKKEFRKEHFERQKELEKLTELTQPTDVVPLIQKLMDKASTMSSEQKEVIMNKIHADFEKGGELLLKRAFMEGVMTVEEWEEIKKKYGFELQDMCPILMGYFKDFAKEDKIKNATSVIVTGEDGPVYKAKAFIEKRFDVKVMNAKEAYETIKEEMKDEKSD